MWYHKTQIHIKGTGSWEVCSLMGPVAQGGGQPGHTHTPIPQTADNLEKPISYNRCLWAGGETQSTWIKPLKHGANLHMCENQTPNPVGVKRTC